MKSSKDARQAARNLTQQKIKQGYKPTGFYEYPDGNGNFIFWKFRLDHPEHGKWIRPLSYIGGEWVLKEPEFDKGKPVYRQLGVLLDSDADVWIVEGEKCADSLSELGLVAVTSGSSSSAGAADWSHLTDRNVIIWRDNDDAGLKYAEAVTTKLIELGCTVKWVDIAQIKCGDAGDGGDAVDWRILYPDATKADVEALPLVEPELCDQEVTDSSSQQGSNQSQLLEQIASSCELFHSPDRKTYATVPIGSHYETWPLESRGFLDWVWGKVFDAQGSIPREQKINEFISSLIAVAKYKSPQHSVYVRLAEANGNIYLDLGDKKWGSVEITPDGWSLIEEPPVKFIRPNGMLPLPVPVKGGTVDDLSRLVNLSNEDDLKLLVCCLTFYLNPTGPFPIIIIQGEQGSAKSTFSHVIRMLIDPSSAPLRSAPKNERDLMISAQNGWMLVFDNLSKITQEMSDNLCRLSTGAGYSTRKLYSNAEEIIFQATRPICLNGITEFATKPDLLSRSLIFKLPTIPSNKRKEENIFLVELDEAAPRILGLLLNGVSAALKNLPNTNLTEPPRMGNFAKFATAAEEAYGWSTGSFMEAFKNNQEIGFESSIESDPVALAILDWEVDSWWGTATKLLGELEKYAPDSTTHSQFWPKTASALSGKLRRLAPTLRAVGVSITFEKDGRGDGRQRIIRIKRVEHSPSPASPESGSDESIVI